MKDKILRKMQGYQGYRGIIRFSSRFPPSVITTQDNPKVSKVANRSAAHCPLLTFHTLNLQNEHYAAPRV